jgi:Hydantoinase B/oxoprolinase
MAHWQDVGGMVPGSLSGGATEIYQEGIRIPAIRIARDGELVPVAELMLANMRGPDDRRGDLSAMEGACRIAEGKIRRVGSPADAVHANFMQIADMIVRKRLGVLVPQQLNFRSRRGMFEDERHVIGFDIRYLRGRPAHDHWMNSPSSGQHTAHYSPVMIAPLSILHRAGRPEKKICRP